MCPCSEIARRRKDVESIASTPFGRQYADAEGRIIDPEAFVIDLLADLRHFCEGRGLEFARLDRTAEDHYEAERSEGCPQECEDAAEGEDPDACALPAAR